MNNKRKSILGIGISVLFCTVFLLTGCAKKGEDTTPPEVLSVIPENGATEVKPDVEIKVTLSEGLDPDTLSESTVIVKINGHTISKSGVDPVKFTLSPDGLTATYQHPGGLNLLSTYEITLTTGITDFAGNPLENEYKWSFTTRDGAWDDTASIVSETNNYFKGLPMVAFDAPGKANVIWYDDYDKQGEEPNPGSWYSVRYSRYDASQTEPWSEPDFISSASSESFAHGSPEITSNMRGISFSLWPGGGGEGEGAPYVYGARFINNAWETDEMLPGLPDNYSNNGIYEAPHIAIDMDGNAMAIWSNNVSDYNYIFVSMYYNSETETWETPHPLSAVEHDAISPKIASGAPNGDMVAVWLDSYEIGEGYLVYASIYNANGTSPGWNQGEIISNSESYLNDETSISVAMDRAGNAIAVWDYNGIYANFYDAASGDWLGEKGVSTGGSEPQVAFDPFGNAIIVWEEIEAGIFAIRYEAGTDWSNWEPGDAIQLSSSSYAHKPGLAVDRAGNAIVVWQQNPSGYKIGYNRYRFGSEGFVWKYEGGEVLYSSYDALNDLSIGIDPTGKAIASWVRCSYADPDTYVVEAMVFK
ncbi:MAG: Ig-like domain-containing protein [Spirochaetota bacterium]